MLAFTRYNYIKKKVGDYMAERISFTYVTDKERIIKLKKIALDNNTSVNKLLDKAIDEYITNKKTYLS